MTPESTSGSQAPRDGETAARVSPEARVGQPPRALEQLLESVSLHYPEGDGQGTAGIELIRRVAAYLGETSAAFATEAELGFKAALALAEMRLDPPTLAATLLVAAGEAADDPELARELGSDTAMLASSALRLSRVRWDRLDEERVETLRKMFLAMARDVRVVLIVLGLRCERMLQLDPTNGQQLSADEARRLAEETLAVHAPLANRLGIWKFKWQLEDAAFRVLSPRAYEELSRAVADTQEHREAFIEGAMKQLQEKLDSEGIRAEISGRPKHVYSIYNKMQKKQLSFDQVHDISALRVITERVQHCYAVLGLVHAIWTPIPHQFDDYIAMPKGNGYQSLHTAVVGPAGRVLEVQVRTHEMDRFAELGVAAHWAYKEGRQPRNLADDRFMLLRQLLDWEREVVDPRQLVDSLKTDIFEDQVFVFTPQGDVIDLPLASTPVDFAYRIHTNVGHRCKGARVNGQLVPLDYQLKTGDRVEILTHKQPRPSRDWMNPSLGYLKTAAARAKVRHWFREQGRPEAIAAGRELVTKELGRLDLARVPLEQLAHELGYEELEELFAAVGYGDRRPATLTSAALELDGRSRSVAAPEVPVAVPRQKTPSGISLGDVKDIVGQRARCCNPVPGEDVIGFVTRGRGLVIHRRDCPKIRATQEPERLVEVQWRTPADEKHSVDVEVTVTSREGVVADLLKLVAAQGASISSVEAHSGRQGYTSVLLGLDCRDAAHVARVLERLGHHSDVLALRRVAH